MSHQSGHNDNIIVDSDSHFTIDIVTRSITNAANKKISLIQFDHNSERYTFDIDRYIEGHDVLDSNRVQVNYVNISASDNSKHIGLYEVTDLQVHPDDDKKACFTWLISENATHYNGMLNFAISFACVEGDDIKYRWNSAICNTIIIAAGLNNNNSVAEFYPDELLKWENYMTTHFQELSDDLETNVIPAMVDERYINRDFATSQEVAAIFGLDVSDIEDVATASEMDALLTAENVGRTYRYTGTTDDSYVNGDLYRVEEE